MLMRNSVVCIALFGGLLGAASPAQAQAGPLHPTLFLREADLHRIHELAKHQPWAQRQEAKILRDAADFPASYKWKVSLKHQESS